MAEHILFASAAVLEHHGMFVRDIDVDSVLVDQHYTVRREVGKP